MLEKREMISMRKRIVTGTLMQNSKEKARSKIPEVAKWCYEMERSFEAIF